MQGAVFGALLDCPLNPTTRPKYQVCELFFFYNTILIFSQTYDFNMFKYIIFLLFVGNRGHTKLLCLQT